jgi:hypothetical protein
VVETAHDRALSFYGGPMLHSGLIGRLAQLETGWVIKKKWRILDGNVGVWSRS